MIVEKNLKEVASKVKSLKALNIESIVQFALMKEILHIFSTDRLFFYFHKTDIQYKSKSNF